MKVKQIEWVEEDGRWFGSVGDKETFQYQPRWCSLQVAWSEDITTVHSLQQAQDYAQEIWEEIVRGAVDGH